MSAPALKGWIRQDRLKVFRTVGGHARIMVADFQRFLHEHGMPPYPTPPESPGVLIADDTPGMLGLLVGCVMEHRPDAKIETAADGYEALIKLGSFKPALLILDVLMPSVDGIEVCRHLKANPDTRSVKVLGVTGYPKLVPHLLAAGADACLLKPFDLDEVRRELDRLLAPAEVAR